MQSKIIILSVSSISCIIYQLGTVAAGDLML